MNRPSNSVSKKVKDFRIKRRLWPASLVSLPPLPTICVGVTQESEIDKHRSYEDISGMPVSQWVKCYQLESQDQCS